MTTERYSEQRLSGIKAHQARLRRETVQKLSEAIASLEAREVPVSNVSLLRECGIPYNSYARNPEALALFRAHSAALSPRGKVPSTRPHIKRPYDSRHVLVRLREAISALELAGRAVSVNNLLCEHGLHYNTIKRNQQALALFREHSAGELAKARRQEQALAKASSPKSDPLLRLRKADLVALIRQEREQYGALLSAQ